MKILAHKDPDVLTKRGVYLRNFDDYREILRNAAAKLLKDWRVTLDRWEEGYHLDKSRCDDFRAFCKENL